MADPEPQASGLPDISILGDQTPPTFSIPLTRLVHDNFGIIMCYAYSQKPLSDMLDRKFSGEWKYLCKSLFEYSQERAEKATLELALFLRMVDDEYKISHYHNATRYAPNCGKLANEDGTTTDLPFREVSNKIIHAQRLQWEVMKEEPLLIAHARQDERKKWLRAEIDLAALGSVVGQLMS